MHLAVGNWNGFTHMTRQGLLGLFGCICQGAVPPEHPFFFHNHHFLSVRYLYFCVRGKLRNDEFEALCCDIFFVEMESAEPDLFVTISDIPYHPSAI